MENNTLKSGSQLKNGEYSIVRVLGQGGFGITYEAEQVSLGRKVAIKEFFMRDICNRDEQTSHVSVPSVGSKELVEKFKQKFIKEAKMIAGFDNDHIVRIHDVFEENGTAYYVMEYLGGGSLSDVVKSRGALKESAAVDYIRQIANALSYLHEQNTLHLDVKPANILLNQKGQIKLIDFGISKHYDEAGSQTSSTPVGISKGFAPLEQYQQGGDVSKFTPATDIYALGATLYYLVTGTVPPDASEVYEDGLPAFPVNISSTMKTTITTAMASRRKDRPQSINAFIDLLSDYVSAGGDNQYHEWVDLGLPSGLKWATCNVGASSPGEYGDYFAWGETLPKSDYTGSSYKWGNIKIRLFLPDKIFLKKYNSVHSQGVVDYKDILDLSDDAANVNWGRLWRMPTKQEFEELKANCTEEWTTQNGHKGRKFTSKHNGNCIFLPATGIYGENGYISDSGFGDFGSYWSSSLKSGTPRSAWHFFFISSDSVISSDNYRCFGSPIRPVTE